MGVMDKFLNYMKLNEDEDDYYDDDYLEDETVEEKPKKQAAAIMIMIWRKINRPRKRCLK